MLPPPLLPLEGVACDSEAGVALEDDGAEALPLPFDSSAITSMSDSEPIALCCGVGCGRKANQSAIGVKMIAGRAHLRIFHKPLARSANFT